VILAVEECLEFRNVFLRTIKSEFPKTPQMTGDYLAVNKTYHGASLSLRLKKYITRQGILKLYKIKNL
jgi:hypothetical protein